MSGTGWVIVGLMAAWLLLCHINILILTRRLDSHKATAARTYYDLATRVTRMESAE